MAKDKNGSISKGITEANITPLADVTTTLIVIFLITMPAIMWSGIQVNSAEARSDQQVVTPTTKHEDDILTVKVDPDAVSVNGEMVVMADLPDVLRQRLAQMPDKTVVVVPHDLVALGLVVEVLDTAKASGAEQLALLNEIDKGQP
jgi:biopolymer transport protein TolR